MRQGVSDGGFDGVAPMREREQDRGQGKGTAQGGGGPAGGKGRSTCMHQGVIGGGCCERVERKGERGGVKQLSTHASSTLLLS